jgi:hypothetical protein
LPGTEELILYDLTTEDKCLVCNVIVVKEAQSHWMSTPTPALGAPTHATPEATKNRRRGCEGNGDPILNLSRVEAMFPQADEGPCLIGQILRKTNSVRK